MSYICFGWRNIVVKHVLYWLIALMESQFNCAFTTIVDSLHFIEMLFHFKNMLKIFHFAYVSMQCKFLFNCICAS